HAYIGFYYNFLLIPMALIQYLTHIQFDFGAVRLLQTECDRIGIKRPMIVTDKGIRSAGVLEAATQHLNQAQQVPVFDDTPPNPNEQAVRKAVELFIENKCDGIIAIGGG